jgi:uncharacterized membrane protein YphA (DoxX/SURF4 family)
VECEAAGLLLAGVLTAGVLLPAGVLLITGVLLPAGEEAPELELGRPLPGVLLVGNALELELTTGTLLLGVGEGRLLVGAGVLELLGV